MSLSTSLPTWTFHLTHPTPPQLIQPSWYILHCVLMGINPSSTQHQWLLPSSSWTVNMCSSKPYTHSASILHVRPTHSEVNHGSVSLVLDNTFIHHPDIPFVFSWALVRSLVVNFWHCLALSVYIVDMRWNRWDDLISIILIVILPFQFNY